MNNTYSFTINELNNMNILNCISYLPKELKNKIIIIYYKIFWKNYIPNINKIPRW